jgi:hypothetical protein
MREEEAIRARYDRAVKLGTPKALVESWSDMPALFKALDEARTPMLQQLAGLLLDACERAKACAGMAVGSDSIRAVCGTMELLENNERYINYARTISFYAAGGEFDQAHKQAISFGNVVHGRDWHDGNGRKCR